VNISSDGEVNRGEISSPGFLFWLAFVVGIVLPTSLGVVAHVWPDKTRAVTTGRPCGSSGCGTRAARAKPSYPLPFTPFGRMERV